MIRTIAGLLAFLLVVTVSMADSEIPSVHLRIVTLDDSTEGYLTPNGDTLPQITKPARYRLDRLGRLPVGTERGLRFDFGMPDLDGILYYGLRHDPATLRYNYPVLGKHSTRIKGGVAEVDFLKSMRGKYDFVNWQTTGLIRLGYRIVNERGTILLDGKVTVVGTGPFRVDTSIISGPYVNLVTDSSAVVSFWTSFPCQATVRSGEQGAQTASLARYHELPLTGLAPDTEHPYTVTVGAYADTYTLRTAPRPGSRAPFTFAYASDSRANNGGGERNIKGHNGYILKKVAALAAYRDTRFFTFTGDLIDGYTHDEQEIELEYFNWKRTLEPYAKYIPFIPGFGNHEVLVNKYQNDSGWAWVNKFPYADSSSEIVFARNFVNPTNGPSTEDGSAIDPEPDVVNFPPYEETAFHYRWDNVAVISLSSNYWFSPSTNSRDWVDGNPHGYVMDNQLRWLEEVVAQYEADATIDHVFLTIHTPIFPCGGHVKDDMWYSGNNAIRPVVQGKPVEYGIIERRDQILDIVCNKSTKVAAALTGDEHNYSLVKIDDALPRYPEGWDKPRLTIDRPIYQINNGAAGAPYYGKEPTPWSERIEEFSTQNAVVFFHVDGKSIRVEVQNPDTMELIDEFVLR